MVKRQNEAARGHHVVVRNAPRQGQGSWYQAMCDKVSPRGGTH